MKITLESPHPQGRPYLRRLDLPFVMRLSWSGQQLSRIWCHHRMKEPLRRVLEALLAHYGLEQLQKLGIDRYGGCFNYRKMRGGTQWSMHAWGLAIDLDPERNALKTPWKKAQFSKVEYQKMMEIFYENGFINLGKEKGYDAMHFEFRG